MAWNVVGSSGRLGPDGGSRRFDTDAASHNAATHTATTASVEAGRGGRRTAGPAALHRRNKTHTHW